MMKKGIGLKKEWVKYMKYILETKYMICHEPDDEDDDDLFEILDMTDVEVYG